MKIVVCAALIAAAGFAATLLALTFTGPRLNLQQDAAIALRVAIVVGAMAVAYFLAMRKTRQPGA